GVLRPRPSYGRRRRAGRRHWLSVAYVCARYVYLASARHGPLLGQYHLDIFERHRTRRRPVFPFPSFRQTALDGGRVYDTLSFGLRIRRRTPVYDSASDARVGAVVSSQGARDHPLGPAVAVAGS